jgi:integrase
VLAVLSKMFNWAERHGYLPDGTNPCRHVEKYRESKRERFLSEAELAHLAVALAEAENNGSESPFAVAAIRLLIFTGARRGEILGLRWESVDLERAMLRLPDSKTGAKVIYLAPPALEILASLLRIERNPYVIAGKGGEHWKVLKKPWRRIRDRATVSIWADSDDERVSDSVANLAIDLKRTPTVSEVRVGAEKEDIDLPTGLADVRLHDLRHTFASVGAAGGLSLPMIGRLLGHTQAATTQRYAHLAADPVRAANEAVAQRIATAMKGGVSGSDNLLEIHGRD